MMDKQTEQFFNLWNIHAFADFHFYVFRPAENGSGSFAASLRTFRLTVGENTRYGWSMNRNRQLIGRMLTK